MPTPITSCFFTGLMLATAIIFAIAARFYGGKRYPHREML